MSTQTTALPPKAATKAKTTPPTRKRRARGEHDARLNFRINSAQKEFIELAAFEAGQTMSEFAAAALLARAEDVMERVRTTILREQEWNDLLEALENPPPLSPLVETASRLWHQHTRHEGDKTWVAAAFFENLPDELKADPH